MKYLKFVDDLVNAQANAIWSSNCDYSKYKFWFAADEFLAMYGDMVDERIFDQISNLRRDRVFSLSKLQQTLRCALTAYI